VALLDLGAHLHRGLEGIHRVVRGAIEHHLDEHQHAGAELVGVEARLVAEDEAVARQALDALQHRRGREMHFLGQLEVGDAPVLLQNAQDADVDLVEGMGARGVVLAHGLRRSSFGAEVSIRRLILAVIL